MTQEKKEKIKNQVKNTVILAGSLALHTIKGLCYVVDKVNTYVVKQVNVGIESLSKESKEKVEDHETIDV